MSEISESLLPGPNEVAVTNDNAAVQPWMPDDIKQALNLDDIPVVFYEESLKRNVLKSCIRSEQIGITCICKDELVLVCLTTENNIYVLKLNDTHQAKLFKLLIDRPDLEFYIMRGDISSYHLKRKFGIQLCTDRNNIYDLNSMDAHISIRMHSSSGMAPKNHCRVEYFMINRHIVKYCDLIALAEKWTGVKLSKTSISAKQDLAYEPYNTAAKNYIKKRAALVRVIGIEMQSMLFQLREQDTDNIHSFPIRISDETSELYDQNMRDDKTYAGFIKFMTTMEDKNDDITFGS